LFPGYADCGMRLVIFVSIVSRQIQAVGKQEAPHMIDPRKNGKVLRRQDFTPVEIECLRELRKTLWEEQVRQVTILHRRLEFIRWLVQTKRMTE